MDEAYYRPKTHFRQAPLDPKTSAILFIDTQIYNCSKDGMIFKALSPAQQKSAETQYYFRKLEQECISNWVLLQNEFRAHQIEVMFTVIQSLTSNGRDRSLDYKLSGFHVPPNSFDANVLPEIKPLEDEIVFPKTSSSVFNSTVIDYVLRNIGIKQLVLCGCVTDQCVEHAVRDACDLGYLVTLVTDACATYSDERRDASYKAIAGYCRERTTAQIIEELRSSHR